MIKQILRLFSKFNPTVNNIDFIATIPIRISLLNNYKLAVYRRKKR